MISIKEEDLKNYIHLNSGTFGDVYQVDDKTAFKIYKKVILSGEDIYVINPQFYYKERYYKRRIKRGKKLKYTDLFYDTVHVDGKFAGVALPYYEDGVMGEYKYYPFDFKYRLSLELFRNAKELTDHFIYPIDFKLNNIMVSDGHIKIIDLDDCFTKFSILPNAFHLKESVRLLNQTINSFFENNSSTPYTFYVKSKLLKKTWPLYSDYNSLSLKLEEFGKKQNYLLINDNSNMDEILKYQNNFRLLYLLDKHILNDRYYLDIIDNLSKKGISIYDFIFNNQFDEFRINNSVEDIYKLEEKRLIKK